MKIEILIEADTKLSGEGIYADPKRINPVTIEDVDRLADQWQFLLAGTGFTVIIKDYEMKVDGDVKWCVGPSKERYLASRESNNA